MQYRTCKASGNELSVLGFGCMRFPPLGNEAERMVLSAIDGGVNFFDTAYFYPGSEKTLGAILKKSGKREEIFIGTKLPLPMCKKYEDFERFFQKQLARLQTDYIDYYFMHNITSMAWWQAMLDLGVERWLAEKKAAGQIRHVGFSYHGSGEEFPKVLDSYPWEFCMIQYNYYDENYQAGKRGLLAAAEKNLTVFVMEPLLGGKLVNLPKKAAESFRTANPGKTPVDWALDWLWNHEDVTCVLSGMTSTAQASANMRAAADFAPLADADLAVYADVIAEFAKSFRVKCTSCNYCLPCPKGIDIPARLSAYNASFAQNYFTGLTMYVTGMGLASRNPISAHLCNACGKCDAACPQGIAVSAEIKKIAGRFEPLPIRALMRVVRAFMG
ncbi:MAG: aldo/keto reductase [Defluviitaleaceae bacterium]|nr:aldo/keto reductase [Defluviitaleaceae bacterium]